MHRKYKEPWFESFIDTALPFTIIALAAVAITLLVILGLRNHSEQGREKVLVDTCLKWAAQGQTVTFQQTKDGNIHCELSKKKGE